MAQGAASEQCTGPVAIWVGLPVTTLVAQNQAKGPVLVAGQGLGIGAIAKTPLVPVTTITPTFFGWGESGPEPEFLPEYEPIMSDLAGSRKPHDKLYEGCDARVTVSMTIWKEAVLDSMQSTTRAFAPGTDGPGDIGTIMIAENKCFFLWIVYPYAVKPFMVQANMKSGYRFYAAMLDGPVRRPQGTKVNKLLLSWWCGRRLFANGQYVAWDNNMTDVFNKSADINR